MKPANLKEINEAFTTQAASFETSKLHLSKQEYVDHTIHLTAPAAQDTLLDVAAGTCLNGRSFAPFVCHVVCIDATPAMLEVGRNACEKAGIENITFVKGYAEDLPFLDSSFDIVISRLAFHHFAEVAKPFQEMARVLKPSGKLVMVDMTPGNPQLRDTVDRIETMRDPSHVHELLPQEMAALYANNGLTLEKQEQTAIPVALEPWMELPHTPETTREEIRHLMEKDIQGKAPAGFSPYKQDGAIYFIQNWVFNLGRKQ